MNDEQPKRQKYRHTRELIKLALDDGMTQEDIARACRTQQSTVSAWKNGKSKATVEQLAPLLKRYGARLRRTTARTYFLGDPVDRYGTPTGGPPCMHVVEGPIVFRHVFARLAIRGTQRGGDLVHEPIARWLVHELPGPSFVLVRQERRALTSRELEDDLERLKESLNTIDYRQKEALLVAIKPQFMLRRWVETADDSARWVSRIEPARSLEELLARVDKESFDYPHEATTVRFLLRKALLEHGHALVEVARTAASE